MSPILGIWASSRPAAAADTGAMFPLQVITVGPAGASSVSFTNIPGTYSHLQIRCLYRGTNASNYITTALQFNGDTNANYASHELYGDGSTAGASAETSATAINYGPFGPAANVTSGIFGAGIIDILDYSNTNKNKTVRLLSGFDANRTTAPVGYILFRSGLWRSTSAITSISISPNAGNWSEYSQFALYGVKGA